jgi:pimeloyl-ACP methyl ester carboxylesterase
VLRLALLGSRAHRTFTPRWVIAFGLGSIMSRFPLVRSWMARLPLTAIHRRAVERELRRGVFDQACFEHYAGWMSKDPAGGRFLTSFMAQYRVAPRADLAAGLAKIECPTAIVWGRDDPYTPVGIASDLAAHIRGSRLTVLEQTGHWVMEERPREALGALATLLAEEALR